MTKDIDNISITLRIPVELRNRIDKQAQQAGKNRTQFIIDAINKYLDSPQSQQDKVFFPLNNRNIGIALNLAQQQLDLSFIDGLSEQQIELLQAVLKEVPYEIKMQIFLETLQYFKHNLKKAKEGVDETEIDENHNKYIKRLEKTLPIFQGLVDSLEVIGSEGEDHRLYAYLAYVLAYKNELTHDLSVLVKAKSYLDKAIFLRDKVTYEDTEFYWYEIKRTILLIQIDKDFAAKKQSSLELVKQINHDLHLSRSFNKFINEIMQKIEDNLEQTDDAVKKNQQTINTMIRNHTILYKECDLLQQWLKLNREQLKKL